MGAVQPSIKVSQMVDLFFKVPSFIEQQKIADFLIAIDNQVEQVGKQIDTTKDFK